MQSSGGTFVQLIDIAHDLPDAPPDEVARDAVISTIDAMIADGVQVVVLEGRDGIGKTTVLAQYARTHPNHTFSLFVGNGSQYSYEIPSIRWNLANQLHWQFNGV